MADTPDNLQQTPVAHKPVRRPWTVAVSGIVVVQHLEPHSRRGVRLGVCRLRRETRRIVLADQPSPTLVVVIDATPARIARPNEIARVIVRIAPRLDSARIGVYVGCETHRRVRLDVEHHARLERRVVVRLEDRELVQPDAEPVADVRHEERQLLVCVLGLHSLDVDRLLLAVRAVRAGLDPAIAEPALLALLEAGSPDEESERLEVPGAAMSVRGLLAQAGGLLLVEVHARGVGG